MHVTQINYVRMNACLNWQPYESVATRKTYANTLLMHTPVACRLRAGDIIIYAHYSMALQQFDAAGWLTAANGV